MGEITKLYEKDVSKYFVSISDIITFDSSVSVEESGSAEAQRAEVLKALNIFDGFTIDELAAFMNVSPALPTRRLPELKAQGQVTNGEPRICSCRKMLADTWWIVDSIK